MTVTNDSGTSRWPARPRSLRVPWGSTAASSHPSRLRDEHPPGRQRPIPSLLQFPGQLAEQPGDPVLLDVRQRDAVSASSAAIAAHALPRPVQHVTAVDLVEQRMEPSAGIGLSRPVKRMLKRSDSVPADGPARVDLAVTEPALTSHKPPARARTKQGPFAPAGCIVLRIDRYYDRLRLPPGHRPLPGSTPVTGPRFPRLSAGRFAGEGLSSSRRHHLNVPRPLTPESPSRLRPRIFTASMAFAVNRPARLSLRCLTTRQASLALRTAQLLPLKGLSTLGSDPARFQARPPACYRAPWRLPGPDFHRQATTSFRSGHDRWTITSVISGRTGCRTRKLLK